MFAKCSFLEEGRERGKSARKFWVFSQGKIKLGDNAWGSWSTAFPCAVTQSRPPAPKEAGVARSSGSRGEVCAKPSSVGPSGPGRALVGLQLADQFSGLLELSREV